MQLVPGEAIGLSLCLNIPVRYGMALRKTRKFEIEAGSGNVFADLKLRNADQLKIKSGLAIQIVRAIRRLGLTQVQAADRMGISQAKVSGLVRGEFSNLSEQKLMECLMRLGYDVEIRLRPVVRSVGRRTLAVA